MRRELWGRRGDMQSRQFVNKIRICIRELSRSLVKAAEPMGSLNY